MTISQGQSDRLPLVVLDGGKDDGRIVAGQKLPVSAHPTYADEPWSAKNSVEAFLDVIGPVGLRWPEAEIGGPRQEFDGWRSSDLGFCRRKSFYNRMGAPREEDSASSKGKFLMGHMIEELAVAALQADPRIEWEGAQEDLTHEGPVRGHPDGLVYLPERDERVLFECKSMNSQAFKYAKEWPKPFHRLQTGSYLKAYDEDKGIFVPRAVILYISKDDWHMRECRITYTDRLHDDVMTEVEALNELWEEGVVPRRLPRKMHTFKRGKRKGETEERRSYKCGYCPFAEFCYSRDGDEFLSEESN